MSRINDYPEATSMADNDIFVIDGENGTRKVKKSKLVELLTTDILNKVEKRTLIWSNPDGGTTAFGSTQIADIGLNNYDYIEIFYRTDVSAWGNVISSIKIGASQINSDDSYAHATINYMPPIVVAGTNYFMHYEYKRDIQIHKVKDEISFYGVDAWRTIKSGGTATTESTPTVSYYTADDMPSVNEYIVPVAIYGINF